VRRILHLFALLALILVGSVPELRMEAAAPASSCCGASGCGCGMPSKGPGSSTCQTQVAVTLTTATPSKTQEQVQQAEVRREPLPWPGAVAALPWQDRMEGIRLSGISQVGPSPPDRLALLGTFRI